MKGFTLVELIAVLAVLGIMVTVAGLVSRAPVPAAGALVLADLAAARSRAVFEARDVIWQRDTLQVVFRPDGSSGGARLEVAGLAIVVDRLTGRAHATR